MTFDPNKRTVVAIDKSVAMHMIEEALSNSPIQSILDARFPNGHLDAGYRKYEIQLIKQFTKVNWDWLVSLDWLGVIKPTNATIVMLCDHKILWPINPDTHQEPEGGWEKHSGQLLGYWRHEYLLRKDIAAEIDRCRQLGAKRARKAKVVHYKAGRSHATNNFNIIKDYTGHLATDVVTLDIPGYEADDLAGALVRANERMGNPAQILMVTTDTDWLGLTDNNLRAWFCMFGYKPRLRDNTIAVQEWSHRRLGHTCDDGRAIFEHKVKYGDVSDKLPAGCGELIRGVIDLYTPFPEFNPDNHVTVTSTLDAICQGTKGVIELPEGRAAESFLKSIGALPFIKEFKAHEFIV